MTMRSRLARGTIFILGTLALAAVGYLSLGQEGAWQNQIGMLQPQNTKFVALGREIYTQNCASCHGVNLEGQTIDWRSPGPDGKLPAPPHDETGHTWHHPDELLFNITKVGVVAAANIENYESGMPAFEGILSDNEIISVLSFIKSTWPEEIQARHNQLNTQYEQRDR